MHGVKRQHFSQELLRQKRERDAHKITQYRHQNDTVLDLRDNGVYSREALAETSKLLMLNPEVITVWNYRKEILQKIEWDIEEELKFTMMQLQKFPKTYCIWQHRVWCLLNHSQAPWEKELALVEKMLSMDARNFHGWQYRRFVLSHLEESTAKDFEYTTGKINENISNFSAWHNRTKLIPRMDVDNEFFNKEMNYVINAMFTGAEDQGVWIYVGWLIQSPEFVESFTPQEYREHLQVLAEHVEMLNEDEKEFGKENVWCLKTLCTIRKILGTPVADILERLVELDPIRAKYYLTRYA